MCLLARLESGGHSWNIQVQVGVVSLRRMEWGQQGIVKLGACTKEREIESGKTVIEMLKQVGLVRRL